MQNPVAGNHQCLMIEADDRSFFVNEDYMPQLLEFCKLFNMTMSVVTVEQAPILDISDLPKAICDTKKTTKAKFDLVRKIVPFDPATCVPVVRTRSHVLETAKAIRAKIRDCFLKGEAVSKEILEEEFPDATITPRSFMQHVRLARKELEQEKYLFERISPGCYRSITPEQQKADEEKKKAIDKKIATVWIKNQPVEFQWFETGNAPMTYFLDQAFG